VLGKCTGLAKGDHVAESTENDKGWRELPSERKVSPALIVAGLIAILLLVFIIQNADDVNVTWIVGDSSTPLWVVILVSAVAGYLIGQLIEFGIRRRRRSRL
jgi:uncharacterized integral membrane protein